MKSTQRMCCNRKGGSVMMKKILAVTLAAAMTAVTMAG